MPNMLFHAHTSRAPTSHPCPCQVVSRRADAARAAKDRASSACLVATERSEVPLDLDSCVSDSFRSLCWPQKAHRRGTLGFMTTAISPQYLSYITHMNMYVCLYRHILFKHVYTHSWMTEYILRRHHSSFGRSWGEGFCWADGSSPRCSPDCQGTGLCPRVPSAWAQVGGAAEVSQARTRPAFRVAGITSHS